MKKAKKQLWRVWKKAGVPFGLRTLLISHALNSTPAGLVAQALRSRGVPAVVGGKGYCDRCGSHLTYLAVRWQSYRVTFPATCTGVDWTSPKVRRVGA